MTTRQVLANGTPIQFAGDASAPHALIVVQEAFGVNDHIRSLVDGFASRGFLAVAPEFFHRVGSPEIAYDAFPDAMSALSSLTREGLTEDLAATSQFLVAAGYPATATGVVGYCMGGAVALFADTLGLVGAAVSFYGGGVENGRFGLPPLVELAPSLQSPWLGLYGDLDTGIPVEQVEHLREAAARAGVATDIVRYPEAGHGFNCDARPAAYHGPSAADATARALDFLARHLAERV